MSTKINYEKSMLVLVGSLLIVGAIILLTTMSLQGETHFSDVNPENIAADSLVCESKTAEYELFDGSLQPSSRQLTVKTIFTEGKIGSIGLEYDQTFADSDKASNAYNVMFTSFNASDEKVLNQKLTLLDNQVILTLYTDGHDLNNKTSGYYLLSSDTTSGLPSGKDEMSKHYQSLGFKCQNN